MSLRATRATASRVLGQLRRDPRTIALLLVVPCVLMIIVDQIDRFTRLALKAQGQCRATIETLALMKNPPAVFILSPPRSAYQSWT